MHALELSPGLRTVDLIVRSFLVLVWVVAIGAFIGFVIWPNYYEWRRQRLIRQDIRLYKKFIQGLKEGFQNGPRNHW